MSITTTCLFLLRSTLIQPNNATHNRTIEQSKITWMENRKKKRTIEKSSIDRLTMTRLASTMLLCIYQFSSDTPSHLAVCYYKVRVQHGLEIRDPASGVSGIGVSQPRPKLGKSRRVDSLLAKLAWQL